LAIAASRAQLSARARMEREPPQHLFGVLSSSLSRLYASSSIRPTPYSPVSSLGLITPIIRRHSSTRFQLEGSQFAHPQDRGEGAESEEEEGAASIYGTPCSPTGSTTSFDISIYTADNHRSNGRTITADDHRSNRRTINSQERQQGEPSRAKVKVQIWGEDDN
jgi:hypothetical protein